MGLFTRVVKVIVTRDPCVNTTSSSSSSSDDLALVTSVEVIQTALRTNRAYIVVYKTLGYLLFRVGGPLGALVLLNSRLLSTPATRPCNVAWNWIDDDSNALTTATPGRDAVRTRLQS